MAKFASNHLSKEIVELDDLGALHGLIYGIQLMAETHSENLDKYEFEKIQTKKSRR
ncbi:hypothetical protein [Vagococcus fluvialis]|uniref:Uncharacterized protein n=1 Tax=Vagococcus fluvialis TaxID=2738 RepID=A0A7X6DB34_9ENTE|nr:hypothetical protein [Vagococcus fluvialis]NKC68968.1 hypothetical protein [Vagococcus fluvialis]